MAQLVKSPVKRKGSPGTPDEDPETPVSTLSSNVAGSDKGYYGDEEPSSYDGEQVEVLLIEEAEGGRVHSVRQRKSKWTRDVERVKIIILKLTIKIFLGTTPAKSTIFKGASSLSSRAKLIFGLFIVLVIAMSWVGSTQMGKSAYAGNFKAPFFLVWFGTCWMIVIFPISVPFYFLANRRLPTCSGLLELWRYILNFSLFSVSLFLHFFYVWTYFTFVLFSFLLLFPPSLFPTSLPPSLPPSLPHSSPLSSLPPPIFSPHIVTVVISLILLAPVQSLS